MVCVMSDFLEAAVQPFTRALVALVLLFLPLVPWSGVVAQVTGEPTVEITIVDPSASAGPEVAAGDAGSGAWWLTTDCPTQVASPCLDPSAEGEPGLPPQVATDIAALVDAEWVCIDAVGEAQPDETTYMTESQLALCRTYAYLALQRGVLV
jgi:hypothetical protein